MQRGHFDKISLYVWLCTSTHKNFKAFLSVLFCFFFFYLWLLPVTSYTTLHQCLISLTILLSKVNHFTILFPFFNNPSEYYIVTIFCCLLPRQISFVVLSIINLIRQVLFLRLFKHVVQNIYCLHTFICVSHHIKWKLRLCLFLLKTRHRLKYLSFY